MLFVLSLPLLVLFMLFLWLWLAVDFSVGVSGHCCRFYWLPLSLFLSTLLVALVCYILLCGCAPQ